MGASIVLDTNVLVSAFGWKGSPHEVFFGCVRGTHRLFTSPAILEELRRVLRYEKFSFDSGKIEEFLTIVLEAASIIELGIRLDIIREDPDDNRILECAVSASADFIVSGDKHLLDLKRFQAIQIVSPEVFRLLIAASE